MSCPGEGVLIPMKPEKDGILITLTSYPSSSFMFPKRQIVGSYLPSPHGSASTFASGPQAENYHVKRSAHSKRKRKSCIDQLDPWAALPIPAADPWAAAYFFAAFFAYLAAYAGYSIR